MAPLTPSGDRVVSLVTLVILSVSFAAAQTSPVSGRCAVTAVPAQVRAEGLAERLGDIVLQCSGSTPGAVLAGNLTVILPVNVTNRVDASNQTHDSLLSVDYGSGFVPSGMAAQVSSQFLSFNGLSVTVPPSGALNFKISGIRGAVYQAGAVAPQAFRASLSFSSPASIALDQSQVVVAYPQTSLLATFYSTGITCAGSPFPDTPTLPSLFAAGTAFASTRVTEAQGAAFQPQQAGDDNGTRFLVKYSGFPANTHLYIPNAVAGSNALVPTAGGDLGAPQQVGQYVPGSRTLLLVRVLGADPSGAGGFQTQIPVGPGPLVLGAVAEVPLTGGSGYAVYEVVDANPLALESAQFPTFIGLTSVTTPAVAQESISLAPVSTVFAASASAPIPRFAAVVPPSDCTLLGDCGAAYFPKLSVVAPPIELTAIAGGAMTSQPGYIPIQNAGGGILNWTATVACAGIPVAKIWRMLPALAAAVGLFTVLS